MNLHHLLERLSAHTGYWEPGPLHRFLCRHVGYGGYHDYGPDDKCVLCRHKRYRFYVCAVCWRSFDTQDECAACVHWGKPPSNEDR